jgi:hypothetical protein
MTIEKKDTGYLLTTAVMMAIGFYFEGFMGLCWVIIVCLVDQAFEKYAYILMSIAIGIWMGVISVDLNINGVNHNNEIATALCIAALLWEMIGRYISKKSETTLEQREES